MELYYKIREKEYGPFQVQEFNNFIQDQIVLPETLVRYEGSDDYITAESVPALNRIFDRFKIKKKENIVSRNNFISDKKIYIFILAFIIVVSLIIYKIANNNNNGDFNHFESPTFSSSSSSSSSTDITSTPNQNPQSNYSENINTTDSVAGGNDLFSLEVQNPLDYLKISTDPVNRQYPGKRTNYLKFTIENRATIAQYKDLVVEVIYLSKTYTQLTTERITIYEVVDASSQIIKRQKVDCPPETSSFAARIVSAIPMSPVVGTGH